ncbi:MAG: DUF4166 domain-containing protein [Proteobacteria bacterium]|nr:DUF4166 domain-containing protein [Pseudomonadota bacterium]
MLRPLLHDAHDIPEPLRLGDLRFRKLLSNDDWLALPQAVRKRFSKRLSNGASVVYAGQVAEMRASFAGRVLSQLARLIGSPLPLFRDIHVPAVVTVTEDERSGGQVWTRIYARHGGLPQVIHSAKRFAGPTGLEECVGGGVGMALTVAVEEGALLFRSAGYFIQLFGRRIALPRWLTPGNLTVSHVELGEGRFQFGLDIVHPWLGQLMHQTAVFREVRP